MSATNSTPNYELPIFEPNDKPSWQGDFNEAMNKIDGAINDVEEKADNNTANIGTQQGAISSLNQSVNNLNTQVGNIKTGLENKVIYVNQSNLVVPNSVSFLYEGAGQNIYYNINTLQLLCSLYVANYDGSTITSSDCRTPLIKVPRNLFGLAVSTISDNNNKYALTDPIILFENSFQIATVRAYYDGTNTVIYIGTNAGWGAGFRFCLNVTTLNAGVIA
jgi:hypothetical protein